MYDLSNIDIFSFDECPDLCPVQALRAYVAMVSKDCIAMYHIFTKIVQVNPVRGDRVGLFVSFAPPHKTIGSRTLARYLDIVLASGGVNTNRFKPHAIRSAAAAYHRGVRGLSVKELCETADWSKVSGTYRHFYDRFVART